MVAALEAHLLMKIPSEHPILAWLIEHSAYVLNKYGPGRDGKSPYELLHGKQTTERAVEFGEKILWFVPNSMRAKLDAEWRYGIYLGRSMSSDQNVVAVQGSNVGRARAILRLTVGNRWGPNTIRSVQTAQLTESTRHMDA